MTPEQWTEVGTLVEGALLLPVDERVAYLRAHASVEECRAEAEHLLGFERDASAIFAREMPRWEVGASEVEADLTGTTVGRYRLLREIGRGGMGAVYLAERHDGTYRQQVALKLLRESIHTGRLAERFAEERQILANLNHPGIARLLDGGVSSDGRPFLVLEYIDGRPIDLFCEQEKLDVEAKLRLLLRVADAVQTAHQQLILHLDIKPANILVTAAGEPKLLDFGISRILPAGVEGTSQAEDTMRLLTPKYASPEQAAGLPVSVASDVFSLATLLYLLLTGRLPYASAGVLPFEAVRILCEEAPLLPSEAAPPAVRPLLRGDLDTILLQALRKEPERRYPTIAAFAADLRRHLASEPVLAHADSFRYRGTKFFRRNRAAVIAACLVALVLIASAAAVVRSAVIARRERATAERRLMDTRALAKSYVNEIIPALANIPGTVAVRNTMVSNAVTYLSAMAKERSDDPTLDAELATGFYYLAQLQGNPYKPNLGNRASAWASFQGGLAIERRSLAKHPDDIPNIARVSLVLHGMGQLKDAEGDVPAGIALNREAWDMMQRVRAEGSKNARFNQIANIAYGEAMEHSYGGVWSMADPQRALDCILNAEKVLEEYASAKPEIRETPHYLAIFGYIQQVKATELIELGQSKAATDIYLTVIPKMESIDPKDDEPFLYTRRWLHADYAQLLLSQGDLAGATRFSAAVRPAEHHELGDNDLYSAVERANELGWTAVIDLSNGKAALGRGEMKDCLDSYHHMHEQVPQLMWTSTGLLSELLTFAELPQLSPAEAKPMFEEAAGIAHGYAVSHPLVLSAQMDEGRAHLGLARIAQWQKQNETQRAEAAVAVGLLSPVAGLRPTYVKLQEQLRAARSLQ